MKKLTLSPEKESMFAGVCAGIAEYYDLDVTFVRIMCCAIACTSLGFLPYFICWLCMPHHPGDEQK
jgi:phage shock protein C